MSSAKRLAKSLLKVHLEGSPAYYLIARYTIFCHILPSLSVNIAFRPLAFKKVTSFHKSSATVDNKLSMSR